MSIIIKECFDFGKEFWNAYPLQRGKLIDKLRGQNIPFNSKVIDRSKESDCIISHKSTNLRNKSYQTSASIYHLGRRFVKQLEAYKGEVRRDHKIGAAYHLHWATDNPSCKRILEWYLPHFNFSVHHTAAITKIIEEAQLKNIIVEIYTVKDY